MNTILCEKLNEKNLISLEQIAIQLAKAVGKKEAYSTGSIYQMVHKGIIKSHKIKNKLFFNLDECVETLLEHYMNEKER